MSLPNPVNSTPLRHARQPAMETIGRLGRRRLTQLYSDTKVTCDAVVVEQDAHDTPETHALHRKLRIQKDRLMTWGVDWSDSAPGEAGDIDDKVEQAGLTETVTSVLGTIKEMLDEAEKIHLAVPPAHGFAPSRLPPGKNQPGQQLTWPAADRSRYEDLLQDLTTSIDTLYDLSRTRQSHRAGHRPTTATPVFLTPDYSASDLTLINPPTFPTGAQAPRVPLPPKLDPSDLILPADEPPPPYESVGETSLRVIGRLRSRQSPLAAWKADDSHASETCVMVEYATYDPAYRYTEAPPPVDRLEAFLSLLTQLSAKGNFHGTLRCLGYFEDAAQPRFGIVYELPVSVYAGSADLHKPVEELMPVTLLSVLQTGSRSLHNPNTVTPPLEDRFRLAFTLGITFSKIHAECFVHKNLNSSNILVFKRSRRPSTNSRALHYTLRSPIIASFDLFSDYDIEPTATAQTLNIYRHPDDPKCTGVADQQHSLQCDMYSLGLILLEVGLWQPLADLWKPKYTLQDFKQRIEDVYIRRLASKCGTAYMQVVRDCFWAADFRGSNEQELAQVYHRIIIRLQRCCMLDESESGCYDWTDSPLGATPTHQASPLKRKIARQPHMASEVPPDPYHGGAKRWALEKSSLALERNQSLGQKLSSDRALMQHPSRRSQPSIRKSISESLRMIGGAKCETADALDSQVERDSREESGTWIATPPNSQDRSDTSSLYRERAVIAASTIQRAWRQSKSSKPRLTLQDYKHKITIIQKAWRQSKQDRTSTVEALFKDGIRYWPQAALGYPIPKLESRSVEPNPSYVTSSLQDDTHPEPVSGTKLKMFPVVFTAAIVHAWHTTMLPRLERLVERALKDSDETVSIDLVAIGEAQDKARPTILVTCTSVAKVKTLLSRRFRYDEAVYELKVRRGKIRRSKMSRPVRRTRYVAFPHGNRSLGTLSRHWELSRFSPSVYQSPADQTPRQSATPLYEEYRHSHGRHGRHESISSTEATLWCIYWRL